VEMYDKGSIFHGDGRAPAWNSDDHCRARP
jgi:hypothetical protein